MMMFAPPAKSHSPIPRAFGQCMLASVCSQEGTMYNDAFALDTRSWEWRELPIGGGDRPSPRAGACAASLPGGRGMVVCCGAEQSEGGLVPRADVCELTYADKHHELNRRINIFYWYWQPGDNIFRTVGDSPPHRKTASAYVSVRHDCCKTYCLL